jgi:hypothetical protein
MDTFSLNKSWLDTCCSDGSEHNGAQWGAIVVARRSTSNSVNTIPIMSVSHCWKNLLEIREEGHRRKKRYNSGSFIHSCEIMPQKATQIFEYVLSFSCIILPTCSPQNVSPVPLCISSPFMSSSLSQFECHALRSGCHMR